MAQKNLPQAMRPSGRMGSVFGWLMARLNGPAYRWSIDQLKAANPKSLLEIGFGTGHLLKLACRTLNLERAAGVGPSELMVETATRRLKQYRKKIALDIAQGDDTALPRGPFDAIAALHSFQFWADPDAALTRVRDRLAPGGRLVPVLRTHGRKAPKWLPNPLSRSGNEIAAACDALERAGLAVTGMQGIAKGSQGIVATRRD
ncbi:MAG: class I SAM-dependent methyltransferase [Alphaproteobacteria bacterium]|nr:class I SAM-dependent methyltransferase [Alphaproteobacteria bacterium]